MTGTDTVVKPLSNYHVMVLMLNEAERANLAMANAIRELREFLTGLELSDSTALRNALQLATSTNDLEELRARGRRMGHL